MPSRSTSPIALSCARSPKPPEEPSDEQRQLPLGKPLDRVDGPLKVTGKACYAAEAEVPGLLYGAVVSSSIARGRVTRIDAAAAEALPGVRPVLTHQNRPPVASYDKPYEDDDAAEGSPFRPLYNDRVLYSGQPLALVVAETQALARHAASPVRVEYEVEAHQTDLQAVRDQPTMRLPSCPSRAVISTRRSRRRQIASTVSTRPRWNTTTPWSRMLPSSSTSRAGSC